MQIYLDKRKVNFMEFEEIKLKLINCVELVMKEDDYLLRHDISERAISHRLAMYLASKFKDFDVDCEYNGDIDADKGRKYIYILNARAKELGLQKIKGGNDEGTNRSVYPDIIVHKRGKNGSENNLLIIEMKKSSNQVNGEWDAEKLSKFTSSEDENRFDYRLGAFVKFDVGKQIGYSVEWYRAGRKWFEE